ncbi:hypothetical protein BJY04DRAFT_215649 [Aspergillus karnatakaensis]|uniref:Hsp70 family protein n=1 Tax=Aspergillus karnatakaensis TaxID=1810916 RepID=UPI003CCCB1CC
MATSRGRRVVGVDYGTTGTGVAYARHTGGPNTRAHPSVHQHYTWHGTHSVERVPSRIAYRHDNKENSAFEDKDYIWGSEVQPDMWACSWTKLQLDPTALLSEYDDKDLNISAQDGIFHLVDGKSADDVIVDYLTPVYKEILAVLGIEADDTSASIDFWFPIPVTWPLEAKAAFEKVIERAGFGQRKGDSVNFIPEPEAAAGAVLLDNPESFHVGDGLLICDAGGGTVDVAMYIIASPTDWKKLTSFQGGRCGGATVDSRFYGLMNKWFAKSFAKMPLRHRGPGSALMDQFEDIERNFCKTDYNSFKLDFSSMPNTAPNKHFVEGSILLTEKDLQSMYDPAIERIIKLIYEQLQAAHEHSGYSVINKIVLVGGLSESVYLQQIIKTCFEQPGKMEVAIPDNP